MKNDAADFVKAVFAACTAHRETDGARWFQTFPAYGRYPVGGTVPKARDDAEFVFDEAAAKSIMEDFAAQKARADWPGVLVDREHFSADPDKASDAMAWATDIRQEADGSIWTRWEFTPEGERLWNEKVLVSRSPLFRAGGFVTPRKTTSTKGQLTILGQMEEQGCFLVYAIRGDNQEHNLAEALP